MVLAALAGSSYLAASARVPASVPDFALQAAAVYRLEVGAACFAVFYLAAMAFVLALDGRGFAELGAKGLKATEVVKATDEQRGTLAQHIKLNQEMKEEITKTDAILRRAVNALSEQEVRLERLEEERLH